MTRSKFLEKFSKSLRWYLDENEAEDIMTDYKDILQQESDEVTALLSEDPRRLAKKLSISSGYRKWLLCFFTLTLFIALECFFTLNLDYRFGMKVSLFVFFLGIAVSMIRAKTGNMGKVLQEERKKIRISILTLALFFIIEVLIVATVYFRVPGTMVMANTLKCMSIILLVTGVNSVYYSRMKDDRWISIYTICLALILFCCTILFTLYDMSAASPYGSEQLKIVSCSGILVLAVFIFEIRRSRVC